MRGGNADDKPAVSLSLLMDEAAELVTANENREQDSSLSPRGVDVAPRFTGDGSNSQSNTHPVPTGDEVDVAGTKLDDRAKVGSPRNAATSTKRKAAEVDSLSPEIEPSKANSVLGEDLALPTTRKKTVSRKSSRVSVTATRYVDEISAKPAANPKKRKIVARDDNVDALVDGKSGKKTSPPVKKRKHVASSSAAARQAKSKTVTPPAEHPPLLPQPAPATLTTSLAAKVDSVHHWINEGRKNASKTSHLEHDNDNTSDTHVPLSVLLAALKRMRLDYDMGDPDLVDVGDVDEVIIGTFIAPVRQCDAQTWVALDLSTRVEWVERVHEKIAGHGLDNVNLLATEIEMTLEFVMAREKLVRVVESSLYVSGEPNTPVLNSEEPLQHALGNGEQKVQDQEVEQGSEIQETKIAADAVEDKTEKAVEVNEQTLGNSGVWGWRPL